MKTSEFIDKLRAAKAKQLIFTNAGGNTIQRGYHLTEIKAVSYDTVDCGGQTNRWNETILQLWVPAAADDDYMLASKFVSIYEKVSKLVSIDEEAEVRVEYGDENFFPTAYHVDEVNQNADELRVVLKPPATTCKARDRAKSSNSERCCA
ncbi:MAG TPA: DUF6428 family protein [Chthoniobacterales bacterium]|nr:DUF6428 family protein [Chthoniobacterales bacterium]